MNKMPTFASSMNSIAHKMPKWSVILVAFVGLLIATLPANIAWYHTTGTESTLSFPAIFGISMFFVMLEYLVVLPINQLAGSRISLVEVNIIEYVSLVMGSLFYLLIIRKQRFGWAQYTGLALAALGGGIGLSA